MFEFIYDIVRKFIRDERDIITDVWAGKYNGDYMHTPICHNNKIYRY